MAENTEGQNVNGMKSFFATALCCDMEDGKLKFKGGRFVGALLHVVLGAAIAVFVLF